jgi:membrane fusion protein (multidrug efflux system)
MKRWLIMVGSVLLLVVVIGGIWGYNLYNKIQGFKKPQPPVAVTAMKADLEEWRPELTAVGSVSAYRGADLSAEVDGIVETIAFESGNNAKQNELLVQLRVADDIAKLESLQASAEFAKITFDRDRAQLEAQAISQSQFDTDAANLKSANAQVAQQQALVNKKTVRAPFAGRVGIRAVDLGQYVKAGDKIVTLQTLDPIHVDFSLPQQALGQIAVNQPVTVRADSADIEFRGTITAIDPKVDASTRNVQVQATLKNPQGKLLPGMFTKVVVDVGAPQQHLTLPQTAVTFNPYGETVFVVAEDSAAAPNGNAKEKTLIAKQVLVTVGPTRGDQVAILKGVERGQQVVTSGQLKLRNGTPVAIDNSVVPRNDPNPKPVEE